MDTKSWQRQVAIGGGISASTAILAAILLVHGDFAILLVAFSLALALIVGFWKQASP
jgi:hypothetical protein